MGRLDSALKDKLSVSQEVADALIAAGFSTTKMVRLADADELSAVEGVSQQDAEAWVAVGWGH